MWLQQTWRGLLAGLALNDGTLPPVAVRGARVRDGASCLLALTGAWQRHATAEEDECARRGGVAEADSSDSPNIEG